MRRLSVLVPAFLVLAAAAYADPQGSPKPSAFIERPSVGLFLGGTLNGKSNQGGGGGGEAGIIFDAPLLGRRIRFDAARTSWAATDDVNGNPVVVDRVTLTSLRLSLVSVRHHSRHVASYGAFGVGAYRFDYAQTPAKDGWNPGVAYVFGFEFLPHGAGSAINTEVRIHAMGAPGLQPDTRVLMFKVDAAVGWKLRF